VVSGRIVLVAFLAITVIGPVELALITLATTEASTTRSPSKPRHADFAIHHRVVIVAHLARAARMESGFHAIADEVVNIGIGPDACIRVTSRPMVACLAVIIGVGHERLETVAPSESQESSGINLLLSAGSGATIPRQRYFSGVYGQAARHPGTTRLATAPSSTEQDTLDRLPRSYLARLFLFCFNG